MFPSTKKRLSLWKSLPKNWRGVFHSDSDGSVNILSSISKWKFPCYRKRLLSHCDVTVENYNFNWFVHYFIRFQDMLVISRYYFTTFKNVVTCSFSTKKQKHNIVVIYNFCPWKSTSTSIGFSVFAIEWLKSKCQRLHSEVFSRFARNKPKSHGNAVMQIFPRFDFWGKSKGGGERGI